MRLAQLARKLSLKPAEIVEFLASKNIQVGEGSNTRIDDEHAMLVIKHFAPAMENILKEEDEVEAAAESAPENNSVTIEVSDALDTQPEQTPVNEPAPIIDANTATTEAQESSSEVIKAPKVELPGLKVLGKIELPEPKKKEATPAAEELNNEPVKVEGESSEQPNKPMRDDRKSFRQKRERNDFRPRKNPVALQREREAMEAERKRKEEAEREKEKRTQNYLKKVKPSQPRKAAKLIDEQVIEMSNVAEEKPKSWFGRLIHWLTKAQ